MSDTTYYEKLLRAINRPGLYAYESGMEVTLLRPGCGEGLLTVSPKVLNPHGTVHGGALYTLADTVAGCAACRQGYTCVTVNSSMEFLRPAAGKHIRCVATPKKEGRTLSVMQVVLSDDSGANVATGTFTFMLSEYKKS